MKYIFLFTFSTFLLLNCKQDETTLLTKKWKMVSLKNTTMDMQLNQMQQYIDTLSTSVSELKNTIEVDSLKRLLKAEMEQGIEEQKINLENSFMEFKRNGVAYLTSIAGVDSAMWQVNDHKYIIIDETKLKGIGETMTYEILKLTNSDLEIRVVDYGDTSVIHLKPAN